MEKAWVEERARAQLELSASTTAKRWARQHGYLIRRAIKESLNRLILCLIEPQSL